MFNVPDATAMLWRLTGLDTRSAAGGTTSAHRLSVAYTAAVYSAYACLFAASAVERTAAYRSSAAGGGANATATAGAKLQILLIRDTDIALLFAATTAVYWCAAACRAEQAGVRDERLTVARKLFGTAGGGSRSRPLLQRRPSSGCPAVDAYCWALYTLLAVVLLLNACQRTDAAASWAYRIAYVWGHYGLVTGNVQFAENAFGLLHCYRELNGRLRAGGNARGRVSGCGRPDTVASGLYVADRGVDTSLPSDIGDATSINVIPVLDKVDLLSMLKYWCDLHWSITQIVSKINNLFKFRLLIFFLCGLLHLMLTPYLLSLTILNEDIDILPHIIERTLWFIIHILRVVLVIYPCTLLGEEAATTQILLGSYLNINIDYVDIKKIETYALQLDANKPEFSIYSMFVINRELVVTLTGTVATYLVIILQLQGQS